MKLFKSLLLAGAVIFVGRDASAQTTATTDPVGFLNVQGVLHENGQPINGFMDFCWGIFNMPSGGTRLATDTNMNNNVLVSNGLANVILNVGNLPAFGLSPTQELYLELDLRRSGTSNTFTVLSPRQRIVPSMFAASAVRAEEARRLIEPLSPDLLPLSVPRLTFTGPPAFGATAGPPFTVTSRAMVAGLTAAAAGTAAYAADSDKLDGLDSSAFWQLLGNAGTVAGVNFLGTTDNQALELKVNNQRALRLEPTATSPNVIAGSALNVINATAGSSIGGGSLHLINQSGHSVIGGGYSNQVQVSAAQSTIGGGAKNLIGSGAEWATIAGGFSNTVTKSATTIGGGVKHSILSGHGTIAGGFQNVIAELADYSAISGGQSNLVNPNSTGAAIGGGGWNKVDQAAAFSTVSGGYSNVVGRPVANIAGGQNNSVTALGASIGGGSANQIQLDAKGSVIGGGASNTVQTAATNGTIAGGHGNVIHTNASFTTIGGGRENHIGSRAPFAAIPGGRGARASDYGQMAHASGTFSTAGDAQSSLFVLRGVSSSAQSGAWAELFLDGVRERMHPASPGTWTYDILIAGRNNTGSHGFHLVGYVGLEPGAITVVPLTTNGTNTLFNARVIGDLTDGSLRVQVRWQMASSDTKWVASVRTAEVALPAN